MESGKKRSLGRNMSGLVQEILFKFFRKKAIEGWLADAISETLKKLNLFLNLYPFDLLSSRGGG